MKGVVFTVLCFFGLFCAPVIHAQNYKWYVLQSVSPLTEENAKSVISSLKEYLPETEIWLNSGNSQTLGCKDQVSIDWSVILEAMHNSGHYLADITDGTIHKAAGEANTSLWYVQALYYSSHPDERPLGYIAKLNNAEWNALPAEVRELYEAKSNYVLLSE